MNLSINNHRKINTAIDNYKVPQSPTPAPPPEGRTPTDFRVTLPLPKALIYANDTFPLARVPFCFVPSHLSNLSRYTATLILQNNRVAVRFHQYLH